MWRKRRRRCGGLLTVRYHVKTTEMAAILQKPLSTGDLLGVAGIVVGVMAIEFELTWAFRAFLAVLAISLTVYGGRRHSSNPMVRLPIATCVIICFSYLPWKAVAEGFHKNHPLVEWPLLVKMPSFHAGLAALAVSALLWGSLPAWTFRHRLWLFGRGILGEQVWVDRETALKIIRSSDWAKTREPNPTPWAALIGGGANSIEKDRIQFRRFIELTLDSFEKHGNVYARIIDGIMQYDEGALRGFLQTALDNDAIKRFGDLP